VGGWAVQQLWLFWLAPMIGAAMAGVTYRTVFERDCATPAIEGRAAA
jgi:aquaporin Z